MKVGAVLGRVTVSPSFLAFFCAYYYFDPGGTFWPFFCGVCAHAKDTESSGTSASPGCIRGLSSDGDDVLPAGVIGSPCRPCGQSTPGGILSSSRSYDSPGQPGPAFIQSTSVLSLRWRKIPALPAAASAERGTCCTSYGADRQQSLPVCFLGLRYLYDLLLT